MPKHNSCWTLSGCFHNLDGLDVFLERMDLLREMPLLAVEVSTVTFAADC